MRIRIYETSVAALALAAALALQTAAAAESEAVPFKLGTFRAAERDYVGMVIKDSTAIDIAAANAAWERRNGTAAKLRMPTDMKELIARYDGDLGPRLRELARFAAAGGQGFARPVAAVTLLPPVRPVVILNAGAN
jgi:hypothetical protein